MPDATETLDRETAEKAGGPNTDIRTVVAKMMEIVVFLFAAFDGYLEQLAPTEGFSTQPALGIASFATLVLLLAISALALRFGRPSHGVYWFLAGVVLSAACWQAYRVYTESYAELTVVYSYDPQKRRQVRGTVLMPDAGAVAEKRGLGAGKLFDHFNGDREKVWTAESIRTAEGRLQREYVFFVLALAATIFCLIEAIAVWTVPPAPQTAAAPPGAGSVRG